MQSQITQQNQKNQQRQPKQLSNPPIHQRTKLQPFINSPKRRKLSYSINQAKQHNLTLNVWAYKMKKNKRNQKNQNTPLPETLESDYRQIEMMREQEKSRWRVNPKNMLAFFPTYTTLVDNQAHNIYDHGQRQGEISRKKSDNLQIKLDEVLSQKKKLAPIRKHSKTSRRSQQKSKKQLNLSFFNVQKVSLVPITTLSPDQKRQKNTFTATFINNKRTLVIPRQSFDESKTIEYNYQNKQQQSGLTGCQAIFAQSKTMGLIRNQLGFTKGFRPFNPPFERFYYFDFLWKVAFSNGFKHQFVQSLPKKYKVYIGPGNNSMLIKTLFKRRQSWWTLTDKVDQANFVWTQIKIPAIFNIQKKCDVIKLGQDLPHFQQLQTFKKNIQYKKNYKIFNNMLLQKWLHYYDKNKQTEQKLTPNFSRRNKLIKLANSKLFPQSDADKYKIHNHLPRNYFLGNKKALFATMKKYYQCSKQQVFQFLPLTFHIQNGLDDKQYFKFLQYFYKKGKQSKQSQKTSHKIRNIWIVKPGEFTNRGNGITVCKNLQEIKSIIKYKKKLDNGNNRTYIVQEYLDRPFLYCKRKFDIRHYMLITCVNGNLKGYWYQLGYIRTTSYEYSVKNSFSSVHLTNDAVQKLLPDYGKYEKGNKLSYQQFQKYLQKEYKGKYSFYKTIYPQMKKIAHDSMRACALLIDQDRKGHNFQIFGFDFMIDSNFHPWLIQINTNPCLQLSCPVLMDVIPGMVQNALKIGVDSVLPPPHTFTQKRARFNENVLQQNKFELLYDSLSQQEGLKKLFHGGEEVNLNLKELQKDEDEVYEDDGVELED